MKYKTEEEWVYIQKMIRISRGFWYEIPKVRFRDYKDVKEIHNMIINWASYRFLSQKEEISVYIDRFTNLDPRLGLWMEECFENGWYKKVDKYYQDNSIWKQYVFGTHLFLYWKDNKKLMAYYVSLYHLKNADIEDIYSYWVRYLELKNEIEGDLVQLEGKRWFWYLGLQDQIKEMVEDLKKQHEHLKLEIKGKLLAEKTSHRLAKIMVDDGVYQHLFLDVLNEVEIGRVLSDIKVHHPKWFEIFSDRGKIIEGKKAYVSFWLMYAKACLWDANGSYYRYGRIIERLMSYSDALVNMVVKIMFERTSESHIRFWYLFRDWVEYLGRNEVLDCLNQEFLQWFYQKDIALNEINIAKVSINHFCGLILRYREVTSELLIRQCKDLLEDWYYIVRLPLSYAKHREAWIIWKSIDVVFNIESYLGYAKLATDCLKLHCFLSSEVRDKLQAYIVTVGRYKWRDCFNEKEVAKLVSELKGFESVVFNRGLALLEENQCSVKKKY